MRRIALGLLVALPASALAHAGGVDANGGHRDRKSGEYHCHRAGCVEQDDTQATAEEKKKPEALSGRASVVDGDTIEIHGQRIRLHGIDAPESGQLCELDGKAYRCGQKAALTLADLIGEKTVACEQKDVDRYKRIVATCRLVGSAGLFSSHPSDPNSLIVASPGSTGEDLGAWMVNAGWALAYRKYGGAIYDEEEAAAREAKRGVWAGSFDAPWDWRKGDGTVKASSSQRLRRSSPAAISAPPSSGGGKVCKKGCPCGNTCISCSKTCRK